MRGVSRHVAFIPLEARPLQEVLGLARLRFARTKQPFRQLEYVEKYVRELIATRGGNGTVVSEEHHIDRDYIEDHSAFYSRTLYPYGNHCTRLHFFSLPAHELRESLNQIRSIASRDRSAYEQMCKRLSCEHYLGFCIIKPLAGCPVGKTILRTFSPQGKDFERHFPCVRTFHTHLLGAELTVTGLPFQQQDTGVAACATTAIWSAVHHFKGHEDIAFATPSQITMLASQSNLPFGRPMPSEGLSLGQMCQAIQTIGVSPYLWRVEDFRTARSFIYSATMSGMAPILVITADESWHAVTVVGVKSVGTPLVGFNSVVDLSERIVAAYVHDDARGPYCRGNLVAREKGGKQFPILRLGRHEDSPVDWEIKHIIVALHPKIRISFRVLYDCAIELSKEIQAIFSVLENNDNTPKVFFETRITKSHQYVEDLLLEGVHPTIAERLSSDIALPRYLGVIKFSADGLDAFDVLLDTTGTENNLHTLAIISRTPRTPDARAIVDFLAKNCNAMHLAP
jgi:hypothetical protein